jgi:hypothetical protein
MSSVGMILTPTNPSSNIHDSIALDHFPSDAVPLDLNMVLDHILANHIPPSWVDHGYTFGLHHLNHGSLAPPNHFWERYREANLSHLTRLGTYGVPPPVQRWDGWWTPSEDDLTHIHALLKQERRDHRRNRMNYPEWLRISTEAIFPTLAGQGLEDTVAAKSDSPSLTPSHESPIGSPPPFVDASLIHVADVGSIL